MSIIKEPTTSPDRRPTPKAACSENFGAIHVDSGSDWRYDTGMEKTQLKNLLLATVAFTDQPLKVKSHKFLAGHIGLGPVLRFFAPWAVRPTLEAAYGLSQADLERLEYMEGFEEPGPRRRQVLEFLLSLLEAHQAFSRGLSWDRHGNLV